MERYPNIIILLNLPQAYIPKAEYVLRTYCHILRLNPKFMYGNRFEGAHLYYGPSIDEEYPIQIRYQEGTADFFEQRELYPLDKVDFFRYKHENIPFLFSRGGEIFSLDTQSCVIHKDLVASGFYFLTCWHEYILGFHGTASGRVDYHQSLQYRWDFTETPVVDVYSQILLWAVGKYIPEVERDIFWNKDRLFSVSLSHDIDYWDYWDGKQRRQTFIYNLKTLPKRPLRALWKIAGHGLHKAFFHNPWRQIKQLIDTENKLGVKSTWFLMSAQDTEDERQDYFANPQYKEEILDLLGEQEVGLHGSPQSAFSSEVLEAELNRLRSLGFDPKGFRTHYLHFDYQKSFTILENAGIQYDSTLGYWENIGFRAGISFPFFPFNLAENRPFHVLEIPLIVMDTTLHSPKAMNMSLAQSRRSLDRLTDLAAKYQSHLSLLWHNTSFDPIDYPGLGKLYWHTIERAQRHKAWVTSLGDIYDEWVTMSY
ncbi:MAG: hypothetical protein GX294_03005 [Candidatus Cloacimonetes bacterium]|nr:hypothetical protein [Candidatus Cloacimonadota bacterium]